MDSIHSWIDKDEVSRLAAGLSTSPEKLKEWKRMESDGFAIVEKQGQQSLSHVQVEPREVETQPLPEKAIQQHRSALAGASAMAKTAGLMNPKATEKVDVEPVAKIDESIQPIPIQEEKTAVVAEPNIVEPNVVEPNVKLSTEAAMTAQGSGTFEEIAAMYKEEIQSSGICAMDADGDILFDELNDPSLSQFINRVMQSSTLMQVANGEFGTMRIKTTATESIEFISVQSTRGVVLIASKQQSAIPVEKVQSVSERLLHIINS